MAIVRRLTQTQKHRGRKYTKISSLRGPNRKRPETFVKKTRSPRRSISRRRTSKRSRSKRPRSRGRRSISRRRTSKRSRSKRPRSRGRRSISRRRTSKRSRSRRTNKRSRGRRSISRKRSTRLARTRIFTSAPVDKTQIGITVNTSNANEKGATTKKIINKDPPKSMEVDASNVSNVMGNQGKHDKNVELEKEGGAGAAIAGGGYLVYENISNRVKKRNAGSKEEAELLHEPERGKVIAKEKGNVESASKKYLKKEATKEEKEKYLKALETEQKSLLSENQALAKTSIYGELNTKGKDGLKQVSKLGGNDAKVVSDSIAKEQLEKSQKNIDSIAKDLGMKKEGKGWKEVDGGKTLDENLIKTIEGKQKANSEALREFKIDNSAVYTDYKTTANDVKSRGEKSTQKILDENAESRSKKSAQEIFDKNAEIKTNLSDTNFDTDLTNMTDQVGEIGDLTAKSTAVETETADKVLKDLAEDAL